jgi:hypothetical protein
MVALSQSLWAGPITADTRGSTVETDRYRATIRDGTVTGFLNKLTGEVFSCDHLVYPGYRLGNLLNTSFRPPEPLSWLEPARGIAAVPPTPSRCPQRAVPITTNFRIPEFGPLIEPA